ncbi:MAG: hypothetical protein J2P41_08945, partial [Blastocatellia bacterium]|nr:hypothetical protein [Blastocatellia bacterium]
MMQTLLRELRYSAQMLLRQLGFTLSAIIILAVSIGTNTDAFSLANDTFRSPLPVALTEQQVKMGERQKARYIVMVDNRDLVQAVSKSLPALTTEDVTVFFDALLPLLLRR